ncbi:MAG: MATE family efflux transporter [Clostridiales bacterium]|nr:MATE family efflux transporter [Clostridiales bacterium]
MTKGSILSNLIRFSLPLMATGVLQLLYNAADVAVVGQFAGAQSLAAVGSTGALINMLTQLFIGLSLGSNVLIAHANGAQDYQRVSRAVHTSIALALVSGVAVMVIGLFVSRPMLQLMGSPEDVIGLASLYMTIYFMGMPANMLYNFGASILRAMGDSRSPLIYLSIAGMVNVILNLVLVIVFHMGVAGVAIATVISQVLSAGFVLAHLMRSRGWIHLEWRKLRLEKEYVKEIVRIGLPAGIQGSLFGAANVVIQSTVNAQGSLVMAGNAASQNLEGFIGTIMGSFNSALLTFVSTNRGAKLYPRVYKSLWVAAALSMAVAFSLGQVTVFFGETLLQIYNSDPGVIQWGMVRMRIMASTYFLCGLMELVSSYLRASGYSVMPMVVTLSGACLFRIVWILTVYAANPSMPTLYISYPISWSLTLSVHLACYFLLARPRLKKEEQAYLQEQNA